MTYTEVKECLKEVDRSTLESLIEQFDEDLVNQYCKCGYGLSTMEEAYQGSNRSDEEFVEELLKDIGDLPHDLPHYIYIDWEKTAECIMQDYFEIDGHYFRNI